MPHLVTLHAKADIEVVARQHPLVHLFELGDLDDAYWPHTLWYGWQEGAAIQQLALVYTALAVPVLMAHADPSRDQMRAFLQALLPLLPRRLYAHLEPSAADVLAAGYHLEARGRHWKMGLTDPAPVAAVDTTDVVQLAEADRDAVEALYAAAYPDNRFDARLLQTGCYYGIRQGEALVSVAGVHVYSPAYQVAALGNVTTHPAWRRRGLSTKVCAALCQALRAEGIQHIGLVVKADNAAAIASFTRLGFERVAEFGAYNLSWR